MKVLIDSERLGIQKEGNLVKVVPSEKFGFYVQVDGLEGIFRFRKDEVWRAQ